MTEQQAEQLIAILAGIHESLRILCETVEEAAMWSALDEEQ